MLIVRRKPRLWRLAASLLAVTGQVGHGIAMLLVALLAPAPAEAAPGFYGEICSVAGPGSAGENESAPHHPAGSLHLCPVCTAYAQAGEADLSSILGLPLGPNAISPLRPVQDPGSALAARHPASPRAPPVA